MLTLNFFYFFLTAMVVPMRKSTPARQIDMDSNLLHELVFDVTGKRSLKQLLSWEAAAIIDGLVDDGAKVKRKRKPRRELPENVIELVSG
jgi:hypothetical protein